MNTISQKSVINTDLAKFGEYGYVLNYLRAHKKEPFLFISIGGGLMTGLLVWVLGRKFGPIGAGASFLFISMVLLPFAFRIWLRCRREWHKE